MSARRNRIGSVLRIRRLQEEAQRGRLMLANAELSSAAVVTERRREAYADLAPLAGDRAASAFLADYAHRATSASAVLYAAGEQQAAGERALVAQQAWTAAAREVDGVERLVERERTRLYAEQLKVEQLATDEAALARPGHRGAR
jgi:hypothetical protein